MEQVNAPVAAHPYFLGIISCGRSVLIEILSSTPDSRRTLELIRSISALFSVPESVPNHCRFTLGMSDLQMVKKMQKNNIDGARRPSPSCCFAIETWYVWHTRKNVYSHSVFGNAGLVFVG